MASLAGPQGLGRHTGGSSTHTAGSSTQQSCGQQSLSRDPELKPLSSAHPPPHRGQGLLGKNPRKTALPSILEGSPWNARGYAEFSLSGPSSFEPSPLKGQRQWAGGWGLGRDSSQRHPSHHALPRVLVASMSVSWKILWGRDLTSLQALRRRGGRANSSDQVAEGPGSLGLALLQGRRPAALACHRTLTQSCL